MNRDLSNLNSYEKDVHLTQMEVRANLLYGALMGDASGQSKIDILHNYMIDENLSWLVNVILVEEISELMQVLSKDTRFGFSCFGTKAKYYEEVAHLLVYLSIINNDEPHAVLADGSRLKFDTLEFMKILSAQSTEILSLENGVTDIPSSVYITLASVAETLIDVYSLDHNIILQEFYKKIDYIMKYPFIKR